MDASAEDRNGNPVSDSDSGELDGQRRQRGQRHGHRGCRRQLHHHRRPQQPGRRRNHRGRQCRRPQRQPGQRQRQRRTRRVEFAAVAVADRVAVAVFGAGVHGDFAVDQAAEVFGGGVAAVGPYGGRGVNHVAFAVAEDRNGNPVSDSDSGELDATAGTLDVTLGDLSDDTAVEISGTTSDVADGETVTLVITPPTTAACKTSAALPPPAWWVVKTPACWQT
ncbi:hypothetical protein [Halomonas sp. N3-2A]|uniref:hypothetical protein n=1 Tax=Halomonas sp. N3-2A TaxID=2014541 RepID=UPI00406C7ED1